MKKLILVFMLFATIKATSQKVDTTIKVCQAAKINSVIISNGFPAVKDTATHLGVFKYTDDLKGSCIVDYALLNSKKNIVVAQYVMPIDYYNDWDGSIVGLLSILGNYLTVTFK